MRRLRFWLPIFVILWLSVSLTFFQLDAQSFWNDEGNSARLSERTPALIVEGTASDIHPPLYYLLLHGWQGLLGESEFGLRALSAFSVVGVVAVTMGLGLALYGRRMTRTAAGRRYSPGYPAALVAGLLAALNPALVYYAQEARMYALIALWAVLGARLLVRLLRHPRSPSAAASYIIVAVAGLYTHYIYPAVLLWQNLLVLLWLVVSRRFRFLLTWAVIMLVTLMLFAPWLPIFWRQAGGRPGESTPFHVFLSEAALFLGLGPVGGAGDSPLYSVAAGILLLLFVLGALRALRRSSGNRADWLLMTGVPFLGLVMPVLAMAAVGVTRPAFHKFLLVSLPFFALMAGGGFGVGWQFGREQATDPLRRNALRLSMLAIIAGLTWSNVRALHTLYTDPLYARADYRGMVARIAAEQHPNAGVILNAANQWEVFTYYHQEGAPVYPVPAGRPDADRINEQLAEIAGKHDRLYAIFWGEAERDPERLVERWLDAHAFKAGDEWIGDVRFVTYALPGESAIEMQTPVDARFGEEISLLGYALASDQVSPGEIAQLALFWQTDALLSKRYKVFLHLVDQQGNIVSQRDSEPGGGLALTTTWEPGNIITDNHGIPIPPDAQAGSYTLLLGLYDPADPTMRLPVTGGTGPPGSDTLVLATIVIVEE